MPGTVGLISLLVVATWIAFAERTYPVICLPYAILVLLAFKRGFSGAVLGVAAMAAIIIAAGAGAGQPLPLLSDSAGASAQYPAPAAQARLIAIQSYLALTVLAGLPLGIALVKRRDMEERYDDCQSELDRIRSVDRLTGVANRKRFDLVLTREWLRASRDAKPNALLMVDADYFELYNECYGHEAADECLRVIASKMAGQPHRPYDLVSRYEGGKFSVLLPGASGNAVKRIAEEFRAEVAALEWPHERSAFERVTVSVGWTSLVTEVELQPEILIAAANHALAAAKAKGKNRVEGFSGGTMARASSASL